MALRLPQRDLVTEVDDLWIPLPDGGRLSAHLWLPPGADAAPVPAIVATHDPLLLDVADRVVELRDGEAV